MVSGFPRALAWSAANHVFSTGLALLQTLILARQLGPETWGDWIWALAILALSIFAASAGINLILGFTVAPDKLGAFAMALALVNLPHGFVLSAISQPLLPALAQRGGRAGTELMLMATAIIGLYALLTGTAPLWVPLTLGDSWLTLLTYLPALAVYGACRCLSQLIAVIQYSRNRPRLETPITALEALVVSIGTMILATRMDLSGIAIWIAGVFAIGLAIRLSILGRAHQRVAEALS